MQGDERDLVSCEGLGGGDDIVGEVLMREGSGENLGGELGEFLVVNADQLEPEPLIPSERSLTLTRPDSDIELLKDILGNDFLHTVSDP